MMYLDYELSLDEERKVAINAKKENCPVCLNLPSPKDLVTIAGTNNSWIEAHPKVALWSTCYVLSKKHVVELFELSDEDAFLFLQDVMKTAKALKEVTKADKLNYEIHGNTIPHLHMHLFPRYFSDDRFKDEPIDPKVIEPAIYSDDEFLNFVK